MTPASFISWRARLGLTARASSIALGCSRTSIAAWETGKHRIPRYIALYRQGRLPVDRLLSGRLKLEDINLGFDRLAEGKAVRQVVVF